jgi:hypothetical protein
LAQLVSAIIHVVSCENFAFVPTEPGQTTILGKSGSKALAQDRNAEKYTKRTSNALFYYHIVGTIMDIAPTVIRQVTPHYLLKLEMNNINIQAEQE